MNGFLPSFLPLPSYQLSNPCVLHIYKGVYNLIIQPGPRNGIHDISLLSGRIHSYHGYALRMDCKRAVGKIVQEGNWENEIYSQDAWSTTSGGATILEREKQCPTNRGDGT